MHEFFAVGTRAPWGDYGLILSDGLASSAMDGPDVPVWVSRAGPFVPPVTMPFGHIIVVEGLRDQLDRGRFTGFGFLPVAHRKTVRLDWLAWNASAPEPQQYPESGEPEDYILQGHRENIAYFVRWNSMMRPFERSSSKVLP